MTTTIDLLQDQLEQIERDLADVDSQLAAGELDEATADRLRATYRTERREVERQIDELEAGDAPPAEGPDRRRVVVGALLLLAGFVAVTVLLLSTVQQRAPGELATGGIASDVATGGVDLSAVTDEEMEAVVADNPDVVGMRLALAGRYFEAGEFDLALPHYMTVLDQDEDNPEALASVGWMTYLSGRPDLGLTFVDRAIAIEPDYIQAYWFRGNILLVGLGDPEAAIEPFERLLAAESLPDDVRAAAKDMLAEAKAAS